MNARTTADQSRRTGEFQEYRNETVNTDIALFAFILYLRSYFYHILNNILTIIKFTLKVI